MPSDFLQYASRFFFFPQWQMIYWAFIVCWEENSNISLPFSPLNFLGNYSKEKFLENILCEIFDISYPVYYFISCLS